MRVLVTGGAGLVGSATCYWLIKQGAKVFCVDNLSLGTLRHIEEFESTKDFQFEPWDVSEKDWYKKLKNESFDILIHLAANSDISLGSAQPWVDFQKTFLTTLECLFAAKFLKVPHFIFSSTSAVYGEDPVFPTPELSTKIYPVSLYGAGKLASEAYISAFVKNYGIHAWVFRFGNVVGKKLTHGAIYDFIQKLKKNSQELEVLGDGNQIKTYIDVEDCVSGIFCGFQKSPTGDSHAQKFQVFNLSTNGVTSVKEIAEYTVKIVTQGQAKIIYGEGPVGWLGDVPRTSLDIQRIQSLGWSPKHASTQAVQQSVREYYEWSKH